MTIPEKEMLKRIESTDIKLIGKYNGQKQKAEFLCSCGNKWITTPYRVTIGAKCKKCGIKKQKRLLFGVGVNDCNDDIYGNNENSDIYRHWKGIIERGYSEKFKNRHPTYNNVTVCKDWLVFSNFKKWMITQNHKNKELDKDILEPGNKIYSPNKCIFVDKRINTLLVDCRESRGDMPIGVTYTKDKKSKKFRARCQTGSGSKHLGYFETANEAFLAWADYKSNLIIEIANNQTDKRIKSGLLKHAKIIYLKQGE